MIHGEMHQCIYCKEYKPAEDFNREHVVSRMLGTYQNAPVLNECQVCKSCNDYFCNEIENKLSMDSYEGFLRMQYDGRKHTKVRKIGQTRLVVSGQNGIFKSLDFLVSSNSNNGVGIQLEIEPVIGIISDASKQEYDYYHLGEIPPYSEEIHAKISSSPSPIVFFGVDQKDVEEELISKGYNLSNKKCITDLDISDVTCETAEVYYQKCSVCGRTNDANHTYTTALALGHNYNANGVCTRDASHFQEPTLSSDYYQIANYGNLCWFRDKVNGGSYTINAKQTADITMPDGVTWGGIGGTTTNTSFKEAQYEKNRNNRVSSVSGKYSESVCAPSAGAEAAGECGAGHAGAAC